MLAGLHLSRVHEHVRVCMSQATRLLLVISLMLGAKGIFYQ